jgi:hypothetical protein
LYLLQEIPQSEKMSFQMTTESEVNEKDKNFTGKVMMMDWRDRSTAEELLKDEWFKDDAEE